MNATKPGGGLPSGVVDWAAGDSMLVKWLSGFDDGCRMIPIISWEDILGSGAAFNFWRNDSSIVEGNVDPFSQMSRSLEILSYEVRNSCK